MKTLTLLLFMLFVTITVFLSDTTYAQLNIQNIFGVPFVPEHNLYQSPHRIHGNAKSIMQNSEKDIVFLENIGQIRDTKGKKRPDVLFLTRSQGVDMYITSSGITYVFRKTEGDLQESVAKRKDKVEKPKTSYYRLDMVFVGMNKKIKINKELAVEQQFNYYTSEYPNGVSPKGYKKIIIENLYDGIDLVYYEKEGKMKYDFIVKAGADVGKIKMKYKGAGNIFLNIDGSLVVTTPMGEIREEKPHTYSRKTGVIIESGYRTIKDVVLFNIAEYNKSEDIIIDPYRIWATYYGAEGVDGAHSSCTDYIGNLYITGSTKSVNFPTQPLAGAYNQSTYGGGDTDAFILKFNSSGVRLWATYYGGTGYDYGFSTVTDSINNLYVVGRTTSPDFPLQILSGAYNQTVYGGGSDGDAFILKFNNSGDRLWATYYGGSVSDHGHTICKDNSDNIYVTGNTESPDFPLQTLPGAYNQTNLGGMGDAFILKFRSNGERIWATYYGGSSPELARNICTDLSGNIYVTGSTGSSDFPLQTLPGAYNQTSFGGLYDVFILKFDIIGTRLWATYYGKSETDVAYGLIVDNSDNLFVTGETESPDFPLQTLPGAYNQTTSGGDFDAFILKFSSSGIRLWATFYGGNYYEYGYSIITDNTDNLYVTGTTYSSNFPIQTLQGAYNQKTFGGQSDLFILKFNSSGARLWATYYGGNRQDILLGRICTDISNNLYVTGATESLDFPLKTLPGAYNQSTHGGGFYDVFILKFSTTVDIKKISYVIPGEYSLYQNYPNPFNPTTNIKFDLHRTSKISLIVYNILGKEIATLVNEKLSAGSYEVDWDASGYSSGVYFYRLITDDFIDTKKMLLVK